METVVSSAVQESYIHLRGWVTSVGAVPRSREKTLAYQDGRSHAVKCLEEPGSIFKRHFVCQPLLRIRCLCCKKIPMLSK